ncbi:tumor necrosis factor receptor superfamily member 9 isoform X1 [Sturnira hondurensis]|uniref:tumor necrosis factor receptor superfamily member 9 isoform X1 n=2 Tax=Sturnira hondurensis TaxID=192404 RepID=UPI0018795B34|nr:tumor necrosis factor receptor superfamily member 9 isoform X1 [Sturnira hondurensis]
MRQSGRRSRLILVNFCLLQGAPGETAAPVKVLSEAALTRTTSVQDCAMRSGYYSLVATALLVMNFDRTRSTRDSCSDCPAGTFCGKDKSQMCVPCPSNSFSDTSGQKACDICRLCEGVFRTKKVCSPTSNTECECISGFHCRGAGCTMCEQDCNQGQELTKDGCKNCNFGTFNDGRFGTCQPWTDCSLEGKTVLFNGTKESDVVCAPALPDISPGHPSQVSLLLLMLAVTVALSLLLFLTLRFSAVQRGRRKLLYILKQPFMKPVQTAQEEDACSCGFPEEEEGEECKL